MELFTYLMAKNGHNTSIHEDLFSYLLGKAQGGGGEIKTATGITINIPDAKKLVNFMMTKESTQETTTGKNLLPFPFTSTSKTENGITWTVNEDGSITISGTATGTSFFQLYSNTSNKIITNTTKTYTLQIGMKQSNIVLACFDYVNNSPVRIRTDTTFTNYGITFVPTTNGEGQLFRLSINSGYSVNATIFPMIVEGDYVNDLLDFEEYTNGPSPNPDYPVEVKTVKGSVDVKVVGKNLWSLENQYSFTSSASTWYYINGVQGAYGPTIEIRTQKKFFCESGKTYIFQMTFDDSVSSSSVVWSDETYNGITRISSTSSSGKVEFKIIGKDDYVIPRIYMYANSSINITNVMIEEVSSSATSASEYEAYKETTTTIPLNNNELVGIGDYKDELKVDKSGHVFINKKTGKVVLNGTEEGWSYNSSSSIPFRYTLSNYLYPSSQSNIPLVFCNYYLKSAWNNVLQYNYAITSPASSLLGFRNIDITSLANWKTWLSTHNTEVYYALATPELIDLQTTVDLSLFKGVNNVSNNEDGYMTIEYVSENKEA